MASGLLGSVQHRLPTELVLLIIEQLADDNETLCTLARTCRGLQHLAEEQIYKIIELLSVQDLQDIIKAFTRRAERVQAVQTLNIQYQWRPQHLDSSVDIRKTFNECVAHMVSLREWHIESPYDNFRWDEEGGGGVQWVEGDMEIFRIALETACTEGPKEASRIQAERQMGNVVDRTVGLALLESLIIHSHGANSDFWKLDGFHCLFRHPTLRFLHVSCVIFPPDLPELEQHVNKTPLTTLIFDECDLEPKSLRTILRTPSRLKHLTLGENVFNINQSQCIKPKLSKNASASLEALSAVAHSLESLTHHDPGWRIDSESHGSRRVRSPGEGMRNFHALKYLQCNTTSFLHQAVIMNHDLAPPNLETLRLSRHWEVPADFFEDLPEIETYLALPSITTLELMQSSHPWLELSLPDYICDKERLRNRHAYAYKLFKAGINLEVLIEMHRDANVIPPYLCGEATPITYCVYDASDIGFRRHITDYVEPEMIGKATVPETHQNYDSYWNLLAGIEPPANDPHPEEGRENLQSSLLASTDELPETDRLGDGDVQAILGRTRRALEQLKQLFSLHPRASTAQSTLSSLTESDDEGFDLQWDELDEDDMDQEMDIDEADLESLLFM